MSYKAGDTSLIEDGTYKATVEKVEERDNFGNTAKRLVITWDLSNGRKFFDGINKDKDGSGDYNHYKLGLILYALRVEEIDSNSDLLTKLNGKTCKITITHQYSDKKQGDFNSVKSYDIDLETEAEEDDKKKKSEIQKDTHSTNKTPSNQGGSNSDGKEDADDDDLPF
jgi:hypothetical protein